MCTCVCVGDVAFQHVEPQNETKRAGLTETGTKRQQRRKQKMLKEVGEGGKETHIEDCGFFFTPKMSN